MDTPSIWLYVIGAILIPLSIAFREQLTGCVVWLRSRLGRILGALSRSIATLFLSKNHLKIQHLEDDLDQLTRNVTPLNAIVKLLEVLVMRSEMEPFRRICLLAAVHGNTHEKVLNKAFDLVGRSRVPDR